MNNSNPRDVQDLIAEFVNATNPTHPEEPEMIDLPEELDNGQRNETTPDDQTLDIAQVAVPLAVENEESIAQQLETLKEKNIELQQQLILLQMQEAQFNATKPLGADELRMEFLNFTSAHIQQFNTRIKKTEELIESRINQTQGSADKKSHRDYPAWLFWTNIAVLTILAIYYMFMLFAGVSHTESLEVKTANPASTEEANTQKLQAAENTLAVSSATLGLPNNNAIADTNSTATPAENQNLASVENERVPFRGQNEIGLVNTTPVEIKQNPSPPAQIQSVAKVPVKTEPVQAAPMQTAAVKTELVKKQTDKSPNKRYAQTPAKRAENKVNNNKPATYPALAKQVDKPANVTVPKTETKPMVSSFNTKIKTESKPPVVTINSKPKTEKKPAGKEKVYFGED